MISINIPMRNEELIPGMEKIIQHIKKVQEENKRLKQENFILDDISAERGSHMESMKEEFYRIQEENNQLKQENQRLKAQVQAQVQKNPVVSFD